MIELPIPALRERAANPVFVQLLNDVRKRLWRGDSTPSCARAATRYTGYICLLIVGSSGGNAAGVELQRDIHESLGAFETYVDWVFNESKTLDPLHVTSEDIQTAKLRWIDQMIVEYGGTP